MKKVYPEVNVLKGIGAVLVFLVHYSQSFSGAPRLLRQVCMLGQLGAQAFLVCTGFLLAHALRKEGRFDYIQYIKKRAWSLMPSYWCALVIYGVLGFLFALLGVSTLFDGTYTIGSVLTNLTLTHGFFPAYNNSVVPGGWFVATAVLIYALLPLYLRKSKKKITPAIPLIVSLLSMAVCFGVGKIRPELVGYNSFYFFSALCQSPAVLVGISLYNEGETHPGFAAAKSWKTVLELAALGLVCGGIFLIDNAVLVCLIPWIAGLLFARLYNLLVYIRGKKFFRGITDQLERLGQNSYSVFLMHFIFAWYVPGVIKHLLNGAISDTVLFLVLLIPCFLLAAWIGSKAGALTQQIMNKLRHKE